MDSITLNLNIPSLKELMKDFYILTGIKIVIFDSDYHEILAYPQTHCAFCSLMQSNEASHLKCLESNEQSFLHCRQSSKLFTYHCHAGLVEATAPLIDNGSVIGYAMFGQISDSQDEKEMAKHLRSVIDSYHLSDQAGDSRIYQVTRKTQEQILAAAKILEACTIYVLLKEMISLRRENFMKNLNSFLLEHLSEDLSVERLMQEFHVSRNRLYDSCNQYLGTGIAEHIKSLRIREARLLLKETDLSILEVADRVGFPDYNYFCRVFKKETGMPARQYRKASRQEPPFSSI